MSGPITGGCICGGVKYEYPAKPAQVLNCYCLMCRKAMGGTVATFVAFNVHKLKLTEKSHLKEYKSSPDATRTFCGQCGCSLFIRYIDSIEADTIWVSLPTVDGDHGIKPEVTVFAKYAPDWWEVKDGVPGSDEGELWRKNTGAEV